MMREIEGDVWSFYGKGAWVVITTNGSVRRNGQNVMGRGVALQAAMRFPTLQRDIGAKIRMSGNHVHVFCALRLFTMPVKDSWMNGADMSLIVRSCHELIEEVEHVDAFLLTSGMRELLCDVCMVRPGCGSGGLNWKDVRPVIAPLLDDRFVIVERRSSGQGTR